MKSQKKNLTTTDSYGKKLYFPKFRKGNNRLEKSRGKWSLKFICKPLPPIDENLTRKVFMLRIGDLVFPIDPTPQLISSEDSYNHAVLGSLIYCKRIISIVHDIYFKEFIYEIDEKTPS